MIVIEYIVRLKPFKHNLQLPQYHAPISERIVHLAVILSVARYMLLSRDWSFGNTAPTSHFYYNQKGTFQY